MAAPLLHSLPSTGLIAIVWSCVAFAGVLVAARAYFRATSTQGLGFEDHWIHLSYFMLVLNSVLQTVQVSDLYTIEKYYARLQQPGASLTLIGNRYITLEFCILGFFWTVLWCVKASWLAAYWRLFDGLKLYRGRWRGVALFVVVSYVGCWVASLLVCHPVSARFHFGHCERVDNMGISIISVTYSTIADTLTDLMIICLPLDMLYKAPLALREKVGLTIVFFFPGIFIAGAIARAVELTKGTDKDEILVAIWTIIHSTVSIIVGCLPHFTKLSRGRRPVPGRRMSAFVSINSDSEARAIRRRSSNVSAWMAHLPQTMHQRSEAEQELEAIEMI